MELSINELEELTKIIYSEEFSEDKILKIKNPLLLHNLILNYNWNDGWILPLGIVKNQYSDISTILVTIELASDSQYVYKDIKEGLEDSVYEESFDFCDDAYSKIKSGFYKNHIFKFIPRLSKVELFKLKKYHTEIYNSNLLLVEPSGHLEVKEYYV